MRWPRWFTRRRRTSGGFADYERERQARREGLTPEQIADREACQGKDPIEAAVNWMRHILARDCPDWQLDDAVLVVKLHQGKQVHTIYAASDTDLDSTPIRGMLSEAMRAHELAHARLARHKDIQEFVTAIVPQLADILEDRMVGAVSLDDLVKEMVKAMSRDPGQEEKRG